jgi:hypothetical protein
MKGIDMSATYCIVNRMSLPTVLGIATEKRWMGWAVVESPAKLVRRGVILLVPGRAWWSLRVALRQVWDEDGPFQLVAAKGVTLPDGIASALTPITRISRASTLKRAAAMAGVEATGKDRLVALSTALESVITGWTPSPWPSQVEAAAVALSAIARGNRARRAAAVLATGGRNSQ